MRRNTGWSTTWGRSSFQLFGMPFSLAGCAVRTILLCSLLALSACGEESSTSAPETAADSVIATDTPTTAGDENTPQDQTNSDDAEDTEAAPTTDTTPPTIVLAGDNPLLLTVGEAFVDPGAQATDDTDGVVEVLTTMSVNTTEPNTSSVSYRAIDSSGNTTVVERLIEVVPAQSEPQDFEVYGKPGETDGLFESNVYQVSIQQNETEAASFVYKSSNSHTQPDGSDRPERALTSSEREARFRTDNNHWTSFSFVEPVTITVALANDIELGDVEIRPSRYAITPVVTANSLSFSVDEPGSYYIKIAGNERDPLFIFANPPQEAKPNTTAANIFTGDEIRNTPSLLDKNVAQTIYFEPGVHIIGEPVFAANGRLDLEATQQAQFPAIPSNTTIYIAGGAFVKGLFSVEQGVDNVHFLGHGVLSGVDFPHQTQAFDNHMISFNGFSDVSTDISIEGLTITDGPSTCIRARSGPIVINNVKCLGWHTNTDGIASGRGSSIRNSFFKLFDDVIKLYHSDMVVSDNVIWHQQTGAVFQLSWRLSGLVSNVRVNNTDIIASDRTVGEAIQTAGSAADFPEDARTDENINNAFVSSRNLNGALLTDIVFEDVRFDAKPFQLTQLQLRDNRAGFATGFGDIDGVTVRRLFMPEEPSAASYILDNGIGEIKNIAVEDIAIAGELVPFSELSLKQTTNPN